MQVWPRRAVAWHATLSIILAVVLALCLAAIGRPALALLGVVVGAGYFWGATRRFRRRRALVRSPFPERWRAVLSERLPYYRRLDAEGRRRFEDDVRIFLAEQRIYGIRGARVGDEAKLLIAASAAMLGFGLPEWEWTDLRDIVVYPQAFSEEYDMHQDPDLIGVVHMQGPIVISRRDLRFGFRRPDDGHNVALHELAHVMDMADGHADGVPADIDWVAAAPWVEVMARRLAELREGGGTLDPYAGTNRAELFAVAVEVFFEQPEQLAQNDPELFELLVGYFKQDPRAPGAVSIDR